MNGKFGVMEGISSEAEDDLFDSDEKRKSTMWRTSCCGRLRMMLARVGRLCYVTSPWM